MRAIVVTEPGGPEVLRLAEVPDPVPGPDEVLVEVVATAVNRADTLQRRGLYPPPPGASETLGLECSGRIAGLGRLTEPDTHWRVGDHVCALLAGGGYAEQVAVPVGQLLPIPAGVDLVEAAGLPEVACTVWSNLFLVAGLREGETLLVHGGAGGIGTFAIQLASALGVRVITTAGTPEKLALCRELGADRAIDYRNEDFVDAVADATGGGGADVILDNMGASYLDRNVRALAAEGRLVVIGMQGGTRAELDLTRLLSKRAAVIATSLRSRPPGAKAAICASVRERVWPLVESGTIRTVVHAALPLADAAAAHDIMESGGHTGKILLRVASSGLASTA
ncbi:MAG: NAD(P)H-quinone oxidoreductase [Nocardioides sp.]